MSLAPKSIDVTIQRLIMRKVIRIIVDSFVLYFSGGAYRFFIFLLAGLVIQFAGFVHAFFFEPKWPTFECGVAILVILSYFGASVWYLVLILRGKWKIAFWDPLKRSLTRRHHLPGYKSPW